MVPKHAANVARGRCGRAAGPRVAGEGDRRSLPSTPPCGGGGLRSKERAGASDSLHPRCMKAPGVSRKHLVLLVAGAGFEPATFGL